MICGTDHRRLVPGRLGAPGRSLHSAVEGGVLTLDLSQDALQIGFDRGNGLPRHSAELHGHLGVARRVTGVVLVVVVLPVEDIVRERGEAGQLSMRLERKVPPGLIGVRLGPKRSTMSICCSMAPMKAARASLL